MDLATDHEINKVKKVGTNPLVENLVKCLSRYPKSGILNTQAIGAYRTRMGKIISKKKKRYRKQSHHFLGQYFLF